MIPNSDVSSEIEAFRDEGPGLHGPAIGDVKDMTNVELVAACFHSLEREYDTSALMERETLRRHHIVALSMAMWYENHGQIDDEETREFVEKGIQDALNGDSYDF